jgi:YYY domain-containing protein
VAFYFALRIADESPTSRYVGQPFQAAGQARKPAPPIWTHYLGFGVFLGAAVASKISVWSFGAIVALAALIAIERRRTNDERRTTNDELGRWSLVVGPLSLLVFAAVVSLVAFRVFQPYAFQGPGFISLKLNPAWLGNMSEVQRLVNGDIDYPPGHQWTDRIPYVFPWVNMVVWGMGLPLGLAAWAGWLLAIFRSVRSRWSGWALALGFGAILVFTTWASAAFSGRAALMSLALAGAWIIAWLTRVGREWRQHLLPVAWIALTFVYQGGQFVKSLRYLLQIYPFLALMAAWLLVWLWDNLQGSGNQGSGNRGSGNQEIKSVSLIPNSLIPQSLIPHSLIPQSIAGGLILVVLGGSIAWAYAFTRIYTRPVTRIAATRWVYANVPAGATIYYQTGGQERQTQVGIPNGFTWNENGQANVTSFELPEAGQVTGVSLNHLADPARRSAPVTFEVLISPDSIPDNALAGGRTTAVLGDAPTLRGKQLDIPLGPVPVEARRRYFLITRPVMGAPVQTFGSIVANEHWDDAIPLRMEGRDGFGMYRGIDVENYAEDEPGKLDKLVRWLTDTDYIMLTSNRLYGSIPRLPMRYPMTTRYYALLFSEQLGFKRIATFESYPTLGSLTFPDQETVADALHAAGVKDTSKLVNEPASGWFPRAEEAFSVYDHPRVVIFQKTNDFSADRVQTLLSQGIDWNNIRRLWPRDATKETWKARWQRVPLVGGVLASFIGRPETGGPPPAIAGEDVNRELLLTDRQRRIQQTGGTWSEMFDARSLVNTNPLAGLIAWLLAVELLGLLAFPVAFVVFRNLGDRGYTFAKTLGLLLVSYAAWLAGSLGWLPYTRTTLGALVLLLALIAFLIARGRRQALAEFVRERGRLLLLSDGLFLVFFLGFLVIRLGYPDLWHPATGGEKPMDFAYLNAVMKSTTFPPYDPWFAGGYLNYYYYGFVFVGSLIKLVGVVPHIAYNFTIPLLFALTALGGFGVVYNLTERRTTNLGTPILFGLAGALFVAVIGNLGEIALILNGLSQVSGLEFRSTIPGLEAVVKALVGLSRATLGGQALPFRIEWWYWNPTRVMPNGEIEEFPFFTFLYADLHAHMIALPITLMVLGLAVNLVRRVLAGSFKPPADPVGPATVLASWPVYALALGVLRPTNTWDYPTYLVVILGALLIREYQQWGRMDVRVLWEAGWRFALLVVFSVLLFVPYAQYYKTAYTSAELWKGPRTSLSDYLTIHGFFLFVVVTFLLLRAWDWVSYRLQVEGYRLNVQPPTFNLQSPISNLQSPTSNLQPLVVTAAGICLMAALVMFQQPVAAVVLPLGGLSLWLILRRPPLSLPRSTGGMGGTEESFILFLVGSALALTLAVEYVVLKGDIGRMNTVFKFYLQVWVMLAVAAAAGLAWIVEWLRQADLGMRRVWLGAFGVLLACCLLYPIFATRARVEDRFVKLPPTVDGMAYMDKAVYQDQGRSFELRFERDAINWMRENVKGSPVILEGNAPEYRWGARFSIYTGLPAVIGWNWHQRQQRSIYTQPIVENRIADVAQMYNTPDPNQALQMMRQYDVQYVIVGELERAYYQPDGLAKFDRMVGQSLDLVYENPQVKVYAVKRLVRD